MSEESCEREIALFEADPMRLPLRANAPDRIECDSSDAYWCFAARSTLTNTAANADNAEEVSIAGQRRSYENDIARLRFIAASQHLVVRLSPEGFGYGHHCARFTIGWSSSSASALVCQHSGRATVYLDGPYIE